MRLEHAWFKETGRASYTAVTDRQALEGFQLLARTEGILPAREVGPQGSIVVCLSGRGDKDVEAVAAALGEGAR